ncbi:MAG TPA: hypothetical protein VGI81_05225 [Tepidisphaeraceae bacterium]|jgi:hypothetical protein
MSQSELLKRVISLLDANGIEYMVTGSLVSSSQGEPRATHDIDLIVRIQAASVPALARAFPAPEYYLDEVAAVEAIARADMFNLMEVATGDKVDFWILGSDEYDRERFRRRTRTDLGGVGAYVSRPEDTILQKLRWCELSGGSEKQFGDARAVFELQFRTLDLAYIGQWAARLNLVPLWQRLQDEADPLRE